MKVSVRLNGEGVRNEALVSEARQRTLARMETHLTARAERARLLRLLREARRSEAPGRR
jgi:hypothetical protein